jgi:hypothetical protein
LFIALLFSGLSVSLADGVHLFGASAVPGGLDALLFIARQGGSAKKGRPSF